ncbi:MAG TPA: YkvA family protein, partial [Anaerolineales bacterium]|nr:YkvA family protein [Anaerolineales bacterium]
AQRLQALKREAYALAIAARDPRLPWTARIVIALTLAHTFSPIDLIPDFIPVLGQLDDLVITPLGIALALRLTPPEILVEARARAEAEIARGKPVSRVGAALVILIWVALAIALLLAAIQTAARI